MIPCLIFLCQVRIHILWVLGYFCLRQWFLHLLYFSVFASSWRVHFRLCHNLHDHYLRLRGRNVNLYKGDKITFIKFSSEMTLIINTSCVLINLKVCSGNYDIYYIVNTTNIITTLRTFYKVDVSEIFQCFFL